MPDAQERPERKADRRLPLARTLASFRDRSFSAIGHLSLTVFWSRLFGKLYCWTPLQLLRGKSKSVREGGHGFVDLWVAVRTAIPVILLVISAACDVQWLKLLVFPLGVCSLLEVLVVQVHVVLFGGYWAQKEGEEQEVKGVHRLLVNALHNYAEVVAWFALFYLSLEGYFDTLGQNIHPTVDSLNFSFVTMTSFGYPNLRPTHELGFLLTLAQSAIGLAMALLILGLLVNALPVPITRTESKDSNATEAQR